jgi:hypothetical protein
MEALALSSGMRRLTLKTWMKFRLQAMSSPPRQAAAIGTGWRGDNGPRGAIDKISPKAGPE